MTDLEQQQLDELLNAWEDSNERGDDVSEEELCRDCPQLLPELKRQVAKLREMDGLLFDSPEEPDLLLTAGRYQPIAMHAQGGLGDVFRAHDAELERLVALKRIRMPDARNADRCRRFQFEAQITGRLDHPGIVPIYGLQRDDKGRLFYAMRFVRGDTLEEAIRRLYRDHPPGSQQAAVVFQKIMRSFLTVCQTIGYAHNQGIVHRDLKPANIMVGPYGETLVVDWGLAKRLQPSPDDDTVSPNANGPDSKGPKAKHPVISSGAASWRNEPDATVLGHVKGSPAYMSPEQAAGNTANIGPASDVYSLGATLYAILTGQKPIAGNTLTEVLDNVQHGKFPRPAQIRRDVPKALEAVCLKAMSLRPHDRYASPLDLAKEIEQWLADEPVSAWREPWTKRAVRWMRRHRTLVTSTAAAFLVAFVALGVTGAVLEGKNRELRAANRVAEENFDRAHATMLDVVDIALHGRTIGDNVALDPVRLELLERAVPYIEKLRERDAESRELRLENALLLIALGDVQQRLGQKDPALKSFRGAINLLGNPVEEESDDWRHARALARLRTAELMDREGGQLSADAAAILNDACKELAAMAEAGTAGPVVLKFGRNLYPEALLANGLALVPALGETQNHWMEAATNRLDSERETSRRADFSPAELLMRNFLLGQLEYRRAAQATLKKPDLDVAQSACEKGIAAFKRADAAAKKDGQRHQIDLVLAGYQSQCQALLARIAAERGKTADAIQQLRQVCDAQRKIVAGLEQQRDSFVAVWKEIDPTAVSTGEGESLADRVAWQLAYLENLTVLGELLHSQKQDAKGVFADAEKLAAKFEPAQPLPKSQEPVSQWPLSRRIRLAQALLRIADFSSDSADQLGAMRKYADQACQLLEGAHTRDDAERFEIDWALCRAYLMLGQYGLISRTGDAADWLEKILPLRATVARPSAPAEARRLVAKGGMFLVRIWSLATPKPSERIWQVAQETLAILDSLSGSNPSADEQQWIGMLTTDLAAAAQELAQKLQQSPPVAPAEMAKTCDPAIAALRKLQKMTGKLSEKDQKTLDSLESLRAGKSEKP